MQRAPVAELNLKLEIIDGIDRSHHPDGFVVASVGRALDQRADGHGLPAHIRAQRAFVVPREPTHRVFDGNQQPIAITPDGYIAPMPHGRSLAIWTRTTKDKVTARRARDERS